MRPPDPRIGHHEQPWGSPGSYSQATTFGELIFTCGQLGVDPGGADAPFEEQARNALARLVSAVEVAGGGIETILKINGYLASLEDFPIYDQVYRELIGVDPKPARTTVEVAHFVPPNRIELDALAVRRRRDEGA
ncbi:MAG: RidA family protein [Actinobacteria bacterium]|nr:RidA family protein [Actinomycetota bacterium]